MHRLLPSRQHVVLRHQSLQSPHPSHVAPDHRERRQTRLFARQRRIFATPHRSRRADARRASRRPSAHVLKLPNWVFNEIRPRVQHHRARHERERAWNQMPHVSTSFIVVFAPRRRDGVDYGAETSANTIVFGPSIATVVRRRDRAIVAVRGAGDEIAALARRASRVRGLAGERGGARRAGPHRVVLWRGSVLVFAFDGAPKPRNARWITS